MWALTSAIRGWQCNLAPLRSLMEKLTPGCTVAEMLTAVHRHVQKDISASMHAWHEARKAQLRAAMPVAVGKTFDNGDTKYACAWLTVLPGSPHVRMNNSELIAACKLWLLVPLE